MTNLITDIPIPNLAAYVLTPLILWFTVERGLSYMQFFQQEEYDGPRFLQWLRGSGAFDKRTSLWGAIAILLGATTQIESLSAWASAAWVALIAGLVHGSLLSRGTRRGSKKPLALTQRVKRIILVYILICSTTLFLLLLAGSMAPAGHQYGINLAVNDVSLISQPYDWRIALLAALFILYVQLLPVLLVCADKLLEPYEDRVKEGFRKEALAKMAALNPKVIAITGSFGKTSTKHILNHILSTAAPTLATAGSINTDMGITRVIREQLTADHAYFIVEMGAYGPGSIARLCTLTPPDAAIITAVGAAHYERFKSLETVARAKFELAEATAKKSGPVVVSTDGIPSDLLTAEISSRPADYIRVGTEGSVALSEVMQTAEGVVITLKGSDGGTAFEETIKAPLYGLHQAGNIALASVMARTLGMPWAAIKGALASLPQIAHRLEVIKAPNSPTLINDAYNSNPVGFKAALETLDILVGTDGRRILVTPGMVELGDKHDAYHTEVGAYAARHCDIVLIVTPARIPTFVEAVTKNSEGKTTVLTFEKQADAEVWVREHVQPLDVILYENNLPDLFEARLKL